MLLCPGAHKLLFVPSKSQFPQSCVSSGGSMVGLMVTSSSRAYAIPRSTALRAPALQQSTENQHDLVPTPGQATSWVSAHTMPLFCTRSGMKLTAEGIQHWAASEQCYGCLPRWYISCMWAHGLTCFSAPLLWDRVCTKEEQYWIRPNAHCFYSSNWGADPTSDTKVTAMEQRASPTSQPTQTRYSNTKQIPY